MPTSTATVRSANTVSSERRRPHKPVGGRQPQNRRDRLPFAHAVSHDHQDRGQRRQRNVFGKRRGGQHDHQERERWTMPATGDVAPRADVRGGAGDRARGRDAAEHRHDQVRQPLGHQLGVRLVPIAAHVVGHDRGEQALDRRQHCYRERRRQQRQNQVGAKFGNAQTPAGRSGCRRTCCRSCPPGTPIVRTAIVVANRAIIEPGTFFVTRGQSKHDRQWWPRR